MMGCDGNASRVVRYAAAAAEHIEMRDSVLVVGRRGRAKAKLA
jgi:hypothetical protein